MATKAQKAITDSLTEAEQKRVSTILGKDPSAMHQQYTEFLNAVSGEEIDPRHVQLVYGLVGTYQKSAFGQTAKSGRLEANAAAREAAKAKAAAKAKEAPAKTAATTAKPGPAKAAAGKSAKATGATTTTKSRRRRPAATTTADDEI
jgi:hypothetical protein